ncbi:MAG: hypothetical protein QM478_13510 [Flavobacteriaceae bacterium]
MYTEQHPFQEFIPENVSSLIVGSFPPIKLTTEINEVKGENRKFYEKYFEKNPKTTDLDFYYGSTENTLWNVLSLTFDEDLTSKQKIKTFLTKNLIGITDIIENCKRTIKNSKIGNEDKDLEIVEFRDVISTIKKHNIKRVLCTGALVLRLLKKQDKVMNGKNRLLVNRNVIQLISPSPRANPPLSKRKDYIEIQRMDPNFNLMQYRVQKYKEAFQLGQN